MSGAQTIVLGYTPDGTVLVPPNSPVTVSGGTGDAESYTDTQVALALKKSANLSDVASAATALGNLGGAPLASPALTGSPTVNGVPITAGGAAVKTVAGTVTS